MAKRNFSWAINRVEAYKLRENENSAVGKETKMRQEDREAFKLIEELQEMAGAVVAEYETKMRTWKREGGHKPHLNARLKFCYEHLGLPVPSEAPERTVTESAFKPLPSGGGLDEATIAKIAEIATKAAVDEIARRFGSR